jgi:hypothetical protein
MPFVFFFFPRHATVAIRNFIFQNDMLSALLVTSPNISMLGNKIEIFAVNNVEVQWLAMPKHYWYTRCSLEYDFRHHFCLRDDIYIFLLERCLALPLMIKN